MINAVFIHFYLDFALGVNLILPIQFYFVILHSKYKAFQTMDKQTIIDMFLANKGECFPAESIAHIRSKLASMDEERVFMMTNIEYKKPLIMLLISIFVGELGIDRFMLGDTGLGVLKLLTCGGCGVWWLVDLFLVSDKTKQHNYQKFTSMAGY